MRLWRRRLRRRRPAATAERALDRRSEEISNELVERGMDDLDERSGLLGRLERRLTPRERRRRPS